MSSDFQRILAGKRALRQKLAAQPITEKLRLLDELRERELTLRRAGTRPALNVIREPQSTYRPATAPRRSKKRGQS